jgi:threonine dehydratase
MNIPTVDDVREAAERIRPHIRRTPVITSASLDRVCGAAVFFKCENLQRVGAFKFRGATNAVFSLDEAEARRGVLTHSSGNHGAALALAARRRGIAATVVVPENAPAIKRAAIADFGARIVDCESTLESREAVAARVLVETGATLIHPYDNERIIAGQGTAAMELLEQRPDLDLVLAPVGGGGLASGTAIAVRGMAPATRVVGVEPAGADDAYRSLAAGRVIPQTDPHTIADGLRTSLSERTFAILAAMLEGIVTVEEEAIVRAMRFIWERAKVVIEPSSAVPVAALMEGLVPGVEGKRVGVILSGGNVDLSRLPWTR